MLLKDYDDLHITGIIDTYEGGLEFLKNYDDKKNLILFLGSSFGNFSPSDGRANFTNDKFYNEIWRSIFNRIGFGKRYNKFWSLHMMIHRVLLRNSTLTFFLE